MRLKGTATCGVSSMGQADSSEENVEMHEVSCCLVDDRTL